MEARAVEVRCALSVLRHRVCKRCSYSRSCLHVTSFLLLILACISSREVGSPMITGLVAYRLVVVFPISNSHNCPLTTLLHMVYSSCGLVSLLKRQGIKYKARSSLCLAPDTIVLVVINSPFCSRLDVIDRANKLCYWFFTM
jgi:hypothetical protein